MTFAYNLSTGTRLGRASVLALVLILSAVLSVLLNTVVRPPASRNDMPGGNYRSEGIFNPRPTAYGLLDPETAPDGTTFRRSTAHATLTFPYIANYGRYAQVAMRLASPDGDANRVTVSLNGQAYPAFEVPSEYEVYTFTLDTRQRPNPYLDPAHIQLDIESSTTRTPSGQDAGVSIDWIELQPDRAARDVLLVAVTWALAAGLVALVALRRLGTTWALGFSGAAISTFAVLSLTYQPRPFPPGAEVLLAGLAWAVGAWVAPPRQPLSGFALAGVCLWVVIAGRVLRDWQMDDAYISYRYGWNLVHGNGLVYNAGEIVEGYTNFLWTLLGAAVIALGYHPGGVMLAFVVAFSIGLVALTYRLGAHLAGAGNNSTSAEPYLWALISAVVLAVDSSFVTYGARGSGIEAVPFAFLVLLAAVLLWLPRQTEGSRTRNLYLAGGGEALALATLTRPEGLAVAAIFTGVKAWSEWRGDAHASQGRSTQRAASVLLWSGLPYLLLVVPYEIWRISFYGYPFPNTFYAKTGSSLAFLQRGWEYTWQFISDHWLVALAVVLAGVLAVLGEVRLLRARGKREAQSINGGMTVDRSRDVLVAFGALVVLYTLYIIVVGGDHFPEGRFFAPLLAPLVLLGQEGARMLLTRYVPQGRLRSAAAGWMGLLLAAYIVTAAGVQNPQGPLAARTNRDTNFVNIWGSAGLWLRDHTSAGIWSASPVAGAIAFYSGRNTIDMLGINDLHIGHADIPDMGSGLAGHEKQYPAYVLSRQPEYIMPYPNYFDSVEGAFSSQYITTTVRGPLGPDITWWERKDVAP